MDTKKFKEFLKEKRPNLSTSSINTYSSILRSLHKQIFGSPEISVENFDKTKEVIAALKDLTPNKRKTILSALVVITDNKSYRELMMQDIQEYRKEIEKQQKTPSQEENWVTQDDIMQKYKMLEKIAKPLMKKESPSMSELQKIQNFIILSLLSGIHIPVRRSKDYVDFKIRNVDKTKDNYMSDDGKHLVFNSYKTAKAYGEQKIPLKTPLRNILRKWISVNPSEYLLIDSSGAPLGGADRSGNGSVKLNQRLNKLFDNKKVGVNILRHSIMTEKFGDMMKKKTEAEKYMGQAGSSADMLTTYVKED